MTEAARARVFVKLLKERELSARIGPGGRIYFSYLGQEHYLELDPQEERYVAVVLPRVWSLSGGVPQWVRSAIYTNRSFEALRVYPIGPWLSVRAEAWLTSPERLTRVLSHMLRGVRSGADHLTRTLTERSER